MVFRGSFTHIPGALPRTAGRLVSMGYLSLSMSSQAFSTWSLNTVLRPVTWCLSAPQNQSESCPSSYQLRTGIASFPHTPLARTGTSQPRFKCRGHTHKCLMEEMLMNLKPALIFHEHLTKMAKEQSIPIQVISCPTLLISHSQFCPWGSCFIL